MQKWTFLFTLLLGCATLLSPGAASQVQWREDKDYAFFFAVNDYEHLDSLSNPIANAESIAEELKNRYGFATEVVTNPKRSVIREKLLALQQEYEQGKRDPEGQLLLFFSGHGEFDELLQNGFFVPADGRPADLDATAIQYAIFRPLINNINCKHILVMIDACYSGAFDQRIAMRGSSGFGRPGEPSERERTLQDHARRKTRLYLASGEKEKTPDRSDFAKKILTALRSGGGADGLLDTGEMYELHVKKARPQPVFGDFGDHEAGSSFLFIEQEMKQAVAAVGAQEENLWKLVSDQHTYERYNYYLDSYPNGHYRLEAEKRRSVLMSSDLPQDFVLIKGGAFEMGDTFNEGGRDEKPVHRVTVADFYLGKYEVTFEEYDAFCKVMKQEKPDDAGWGRGRRPVINVNWYDAVKYCNWRSALEGLQSVYTINENWEKKRQITADWTANGYRLPTEAEWEYAARQGGQKVRFGNGQDLADPQHINFDGRESYKKDYSVAGVYRQQTVEVGSLPANELGLHEMSGNVWEWCWDWYGADYYGQSNNSQEPKGPDGGAYRVVRGGSWDGYSDACRAAERNRFSPDLRYFNLVGFRLARRS